MIWWTGVELQQCNKLEQSEHYCLFDPLTDDIGSNASTCHHSSLNTPAKVTLVTSEDTNISTKWHFSKKFKGPSVSPCCNLTQDSSAQLTMSPI